MTSMEEWYCFRQNRQMLLTVRQVTRRTSSTPNKLEVRERGDYSYLIVVDFPTLANNHDLLFFPCRL